MPLKDNELPENSKKNLERRLDHAIEETFPDSDPVSVSVTKGGAIDYDRQDSAPTGTPEGTVQKGKNTAESLLKQARGTASGVAGAVAGAAREAYEEGQRYVSEARERYPEAEHYYRERTQNVRPYAAENPLLTLLAGVGIGYALAWMIHSSGSERHDQVPDNTRRGYEPHRPQRHG